MCHCCTFHICTQRTGAQVNLLTGLRIGDELVAGGDGADMAGASRSVCRLLEQLGRGHQLLQLDWDIVITERPTNDQIHWLY